MATKKSSDPLVDGIPLSDWEKRLTSADTQERELAVKILENLDKRALKALPLFLKLLEHPASEVQAAALQLLNSLDCHCRGQVGPLVQPATAILIDLLSRNDELSRIRAASLLCSIGPAAETALFKIQQLLSRASESNAAFTTGKLYKFGAAAVPFLIEALSSANMNVRSQAAYGLGMLGAAATTAVPVMLNALNDNVQVACYAANALGAIACQPELAVPALINFVDHENRELARAAITSLGQFGPEAAPAIPRLLPLLEPGDWDWGPLFAAQTLGKIGPAAAVALEPLQRLLTSKYRQMREEVQIAINLIKGESPPIEFVEKRQQPAKDDTLFDFALTKKVVAKMLSEGVANFAKEHPEEQVASVALFSPSFGSYTCLCIATPQEVPVNLSNGGTYDFKYSEYAHEDFAWWPNLYEVASPFTIKLPDGKLIKRNMDKLGNNAIDQPLFKLLVEIMIEALPFTGLNTVPGFRVGVEVYNSEFIKFWTPKK